MNKEVAKWTEGGGFSQQHEVLEICKYEYLCFAKT